MPKYASQNIIKIVRHATCEKPKSFEALSAKIGQELILRAARDHAENGLAAIQLVKLQLYREGFTRGYRPITPNLLLREIRAKRLWPKIL
jgi:hypothetical protein